MHTPFLPSYTDCSLLTSCPCLALVCQSIELSRFYACLSPFLSTKWKGIGSKASAECLLPHSEGRDQSSHFCPISLVGKGPQSKVCMFLLKSVSASTIWTKWQMLQWGRLDTPEMLNSGASVPFNAFVELQVGPVSTTKPTQQDTYLHSCFFPQYSPGNSWTSFLCH